MTSDPGDARSAVPVAGCHGLAWVRFALILAVLLVGDLALKHWAFRTDAIAAFPVRIVQDIESVINAPPAIVTGEQVVLFSEPHTIVQPDAGVVAVPYLLNFRLTLNTGAVFGMGQGGRWFFVAVSVLAVGVVLYLFTRSPAKSWLLQSALAMILAGALGNLYDRLAYGAVRDMLLMLPELGLWPWIFNLADAVLMIGVGLVLLRSFFPEKVPAQGAPASERPQA